MPLISTQEIRNEHRMDSTTSTDVSELVERAMQKIADQFAISNEPVEISTDARRDRGVSVEFDLQISGKAAVACQDFVGTKLAELYYACQDAGGPWNRLRASFVAKRGKSWQVTTDVSYHTDLAQKIEVALPLNSNAPKMSPPFRELFSRHAGLSFQKFLQLTESLPINVEWSFDASANTLLFKSELDEGETDVEQVSYAVEPIGVYSEQRGAWRWAWENKNTKNVSAAAITAREIGQLTGATELTLPTLTAEAADPECLAMVACGATAGDFWFECEGEHESVFVVGRCNQLRHARNTAPDRIAYVFLELIEAFPCEQTATLRSYLEGSGYTIDENGPLWRAVDNQGREFEAMFSKNGELEQISLPE